VCVISLVFHIFNVLYFYVVVAIKNMEKLSAMGGLLPDKNKNRVSPLTAHEISAEFDVLYNR
jgi:hypothetical protein